MKTPRKKGRKPAKRVKYMKHAWTAYKLTEADYDDMVLESEGRCAICYEPEQLVIDHCHTTGRVRGLLCNYCNYQLGVYEKGNEGELDVEAARRYLGWEDPYLG